MAIYWNKTELKICEKKENIQEKDQSDLIYESDLKILRIFTLK